MGEKIQTTVSGTEPDYRSPHIDAYSQAIKDLFAADRLDESLSIEEALEETLSKGTPSDNFDSMFDGLDEEDPTIKLLSLVFQDTDYNNDRFKKEFAAHIQNGANPYILVSHEISREIIFSDPALMDIVIKSGLDFNLAGKAASNIGNASDITNIAARDTFQMQSATTLSQTGFQKNWDKYAETQETLTKTFPDLKPDIDDVLRFSEKRHLFNDEYQTHSIYMVHRGLMNAYVEHGVFNEEDAEKFLSNFKMHVTPGTTVDVQDYHNKEFDTLRVGSAEHTIKSGDALWNIAERYKPYSNTLGTQKLVDQIYEQNGLDSNNLSLNKILRIPVDPNAHIITIRIPKGSNVSTEALKYQDHLYSSTGNPYLDAKAIMDLNGLDINQTVQAGEGLRLAIKEDFASVASLNLPANKDVTLAVIEKNGDHHRMTFETASKLSYYLSNDHVDSDVIAITTPELGKIIDPKMMGLYQSENARNGNIIFSRSYGEVGLDINPDKIEEKFDNSKSKYNEYTRQEFEFLENNQVISFFAIGNSYDTAPSLYTASIDSNSVRSVTVGAIHEQNGIPYVAGYSSIGGDICAKPIHKIDNEQVYGTSFSTPDMAEHYKKMAQAYGNDLTHEEIMAAASYSTNVRIKDFDIYQSPDLAKKNDDGEITAGLKDSVVDQLPWAKFEINAAGVPHHARAGAGMIDIDKWKENLEQIKTIKLATNNDSEIISQQTNLRDIELEKIQEDGKDLYVYKIPIDTDMTLGKITFALPQEKGHHSTASVEGPSGTKQDLPYLNNSMFSTNILAYESANEGEFITIKSEEKFTDDADIIIRGHEAGNTIEAFRDYMVQNNLTKTPGTDYQEQDIAQTIANKTDITASNITSI